MSRSGPPTGSGAAGHAETWALIPWLVNGRADAAQRARAEHHLAHCADCRAEQQAQQQLQRALSEEPPAPGADLDAERGLQRLLGRLDPWPVEPEGFAAAAAPAAAAPRPRAGRLPMALAAAVLLQAIVLVVLGLQLRDTDDPAYRTLSQAPALAAGTARWRVVPDAALPMAQWQALLQDLGLRVVDGPNAVGAYALAPRAAAASTGDAAAVLARLRAAPGVRLAEALEAP
jgi:hypothetical protein